MRKIISLVALFCILIGTVSCAKQTEEDTSETTTAAVVDNTTAETVAETEFKAFNTVDLKNYEGHTFHILYSQTDNCYTDFFAEEMNGSIMNDDIFKRNIQVEEALGINIEITWEPYSEVNTDLQTQVTSGNADYDIYGGHKSSLALSYSGYLYDYYKMDQIDLDSEWWDQDWVDTMSVGGSLYTLVGDISVSSLLFVSSLCFNKQLFDDNGLSYPYDLVRDKKWTYDALYNLIQNYSQDINGDGQMTYETDRFGLTGWGTEAGYSLFYGSGFTFITKTADDIYVMDFNTERLTSIMDKVFNVWITANSYFNNNGTSAQHPYPFSIFTENRALFCDSVLSKIGTFLTDMESDYGILPQPMYDENQEDYCSYTGYTIPVTMVPINCPDANRTGTIMEALCTASYDEVTPDMYEIVTSIKNARDSESSEMISIIIRNKFFDPAHWYTISGYGTFSRTMIASGSNNVASMVKSYDKVARKNLDNIINSFEKLNQQ